MPSARRLAIAEPVLTAIGATAVVGCAGCKRRGVEPDARHPPESEAARSLAGARPDPCHPAPSRPVRRCDPARRAGHAR
jgi:hypothetical protein